MLKKIFKLNAIFITLFFFTLNQVRAYDLQNPSNEESINNKIKSIYQSKELYDDIYGTGKDEVFNFITSDQFWWPIGSEETTIINGIEFATGEPQSLGMSDGYGCFEWRANKEKGETCGWHNGLDISGLGLPPGTINVIAAKSGKVIYPTTIEQTQFEDHTGSAYGNDDGGGLGNYVIIDHNDGTYTVYGHMAKDSIRVLADNDVIQGQVIGKVGHTGSSTAPHLHFMVKVGSTAVDPLDYISADNPRPFGSNGTFSLTETVLSKNEFISKMNNYCDRTKNKAFCNNFAAVADKIYDASINNKVNPELVVVTAGTEQSWNLSDACKYTNNYWGINIKNGESCNSGGIYSSISEGIAAYADIIAEYSPGGYYEQDIINKYNERQDSKCDAGGHGLPGTLEGMQSLYSSVGRFRYNPGKSGLGGCYYFNNKLYNKNYCNTVPTCKVYKDVDRENVGICPEESKVTVCEQNDYTAYQVSVKKSFRFDIFGL